MSIAQTAELAVLLRLQNLLSGPAAQAEASLSSLNAATSRTGAGAATASTALSRVGVMATGMGNALNHAKGFLGGLVSGPLGMLGLGAATFSLAGALKSGIDTANTMALSMEKLQALTGETAQQTSGLLAVTGKFGITSQAVGTIVGFEEKTVGKLAETTAKATKAGVSAALQSLETKKLKDQEIGASTKLVDKLIAEQKARDALTASHSGALPVLNKLVALQQQYGVVLTNSKGQALDFSTILNHVSDYYNSNATQGQKAALAATVFGRGYAAMIPVLQLGSAGFAKAQAAAVSLGLTLTSQNAVDLKNYQENWRQLGDAIGGLQLQMSLALLPTLNDIAKSITGFVGTHRDDLINFFRGGIGAAREIGGALLGVGQAAAGAWNAIPGPLRTLLIETLVGNKVIKTVFGINIMGSVEGAIGGAVGGLLKNAFGSLFGKTIATPVVNVDGAVVNVGGVPVGSVTNAAGDVSLLSQIGKTVGDAVKLVVLPAVVLAAIKNLFPGVNTAPGGGNVLPIGGGIGVNNGQLGPPGTSYGLFGPPGAGTASPMAPWQPGQVSMTVDALTRIKEGVNHLNAAQLRVEAAMLQRFAHQDAKKALGPVDPFLTALRTGGATVAIKDFPLHLRYLETASAQQKQSAVYARTLANDQAALKRDLVGATNAQKATINADLVRLQALVMATTAAVKGVTLTVDQITNIKEVPAGLNPKLGPPAPINLHLPKHPAIPIRDTNTAIILKGRFGPGSPAGAGMQ